MGDPRIMFDVLEDKADGVMMSPVLSENAGSSWGPYFTALFPPHLVSPWIAWKIGSSGVNVARRLWDQREELRTAHEQLYGHDPDLWPQGHPGVVLDAVDFLAHPACLRCHWFEPEGFDVRQLDRVSLARQLAAGHQQGSQVEHPHDC